MTRFVLVTAALASSVVWGQSSAKTLEDRKAVTFNEIERGFFLGANGGFWGTILPPGTGNRPFLGGQAVQVEIGYDVGERVSPALFFIGAATSRAGSDYKGLSTAENPASGDFGMLVPGVTAKIRIVGFTDSQEVRRTWLYARASVGYVIYSPTALIPRADVLLSVGPGVEYFTRLRHFSIGVEANVNILALTASVGFSILPTVRYAF